MSTTTPNLTLTLYDSTTDQVVTFATFRAVWGGTATTSNFYRIDTWAGTVNSSITTLQNQRGAITVPASYVSANYYEATVASITSYITGMTILLKLDTDSAGTLTLNINALGTKSVTKVNSSGSIVNIAGGELQSNRYYMFTYDGTQWVWVNATSADQVYNGGTSGNIVLVASDGSISDSSAPTTVVGSAVYNATAKTTLANADTIGITDSAASNVLKKITWSNFQTAIGTALGAIINALTGKTTPVGADVIVIGDSASSFASKLVLLSNLYKSLGTGTQDSTTFLRGDGTYAIPPSPGLTNVSLSVTTSDVNPTAGNRYLLDISGMTADRNFILPTATSGQEIVVTLTAGDSAYELILKGAATVTITGKGGTTAAATEWSRIFITGETIHFVATSSTNWQIVEDGRIPCHAIMQRQASQNLTTATITQIQLDTNKVNVGDMNDLTNYRANIRRTGNYSIFPAVIMANGFSDQKNVQALIYIDGSTLETYGIGYTSTSTTNQPGMGYIPYGMPLNANQTVDMRGYHNQGSTVATNTTYYCNFIVKEEL